MNIRKTALLALSSAAAITIACAAPARADTVVATISGSYDLLRYDTPALTFHNTSGGAFTNAKMVLHGYQGRNNGLTAIVNLPDMPNATDSNAIWGELPGVNGGTTPGNLTAYDYDDEWGNADAPNARCVLNFPLCAQVGNFDVTFTATISGGSFDGEHVFSVFSPTSNATGGFVGWEGLDEDGWSETSTFDVHGGSVTGTLAEIKLGDPPPPGIPEPASWALMITGFGMAGAALRRRRAAVATA